MFARAPILPAWRWRHKNEKIRQLHRRAGPCLRLPHAIPLPDCRSLLMRSRKKLLVWFTGSPKIVQACRSASGQSRHLDQTRATSGLARTIMNEAANWGVECVSAPRKRTKITAGAIAAIIVIGMMVIIALAFLLQPPS
jgi:hypothetical protein